MREMYSTLFIALVAFVVGGVASLAMNRCHEYTAGTYQQRGDTITLILSEAEYRDSVVAEEARKVGVDAKFSIAVAHVENRRGIPTAISRAGAVGVMQVMPSVWAGSFPRCGEDLFNVRTNACYGVHILSYYQAFCLAIDGLPTGSAAHRACVLARYNGAVTPWKAEVYVAAVNTAAAGI